MSPSVQLKHGFMKSTITIYLHGYQQTVFMRLSELQTYFERIIKSKFY